MKRLIARIKSPEFKEAFKDYLLAVAASGVTMGIALLMDFAPEYAVLIGGITAPLVRWADKNSPHYGRKK
jgi:hypothetical protein